MTRGPAGYGRYNDDPEYVGCPRAKSDMTPCIARDGHLALAGDPPSDCVGCGQAPDALLAELLRAHPPSAARAKADAADQEARADLLAGLVRKATEPAAEREPR